MNFPRKISRPSGQYVYERTAKSNDERQSLLSRSESKAHRGGSGIGHALLRRRSRRGVENSQFQTAAGNARVRRRIGRRTADAHFAYPHLSGLSLLSGREGIVHNYLTGILRNKSLKLLEEIRETSEKKSRYEERRVDPETEEEKRFKTWQESVFEIALQQLLADDAIHGRTREVFRRTAVNGEDIATVAESFGITRNAVDQMKNRMMSRLRELVADLEKVDDARIERTRT